MNDFGRLSSAEQRLVAMLRAHLATCPECYALQEAANAAETCPDMARIIAQAESGEDDLGDIALGVPPGILAAMAAHRKTCPRCPAEPARRECSTAMHLREELWDLVYRQMAEEVRDRGNVAEAERIDALRAQRRGERDEAFQRPRSDNQPQ